MSTFAHETGNPSILSPIYTDCFARLRDVRAKVDALCVGDPDFGDSVNSDHIEFDDALNLAAHKSIAYKCQCERYYDIEETDVNIAGFLMVFLKKTWEAHGFSDNSIRFDSEFTDKVKAAGGRLAVMQGVYVFHDYRLGHDNPAYYINHLI